MRSSASLSSPLPTPRPAADARVPPVYARLLHLLLLQAEVDGDRVLAEAGLAHAMLVGDERPLGRDTVVALARAAMAATRRPWLGLDLGGAPASSHGALGYAAVTSRDLRGLLTTLARYGATRNDALRWRCLETPSGLSVVAIEGFDFDAVRGFVMDTTLAAVLRLVETALGQIPASLSVELPLPRPPWHSQYGRFAPATLRFDRPLFAFHAGHADLARPCLGADTRAHAMACLECERALAETPAARDEGLARRVAGLLDSVEPGASGALGGGYPDLPTAARRCALSPRTLARRLQAEGTSYRALLEAARRARAQALLHQTRLPVEEIARRLGYVDTSNFSRTVRRWFGATPRALRAGPAPR